MTNKEVARLGRLDGIWDRVTDTTWAKDRRMLRRRWMVLSEIKKRIWEFAYQDAVNRLPVG